MKYKVYGWLMALLLLPFFLVSCNGNSNNIPAPTQHEVLNGVYICNEGNFMYGNSSLSLYDKDKEVVINNAFYDVNGFPLGDVCQSMTVIGSRGFLVINNSGKVYVIDLKTTKNLGVIKGLTSPRYVQLVNNDKIYITDLYSKSITIVNPTTFEITGSINVGASTEQMAMYGDYVYTSTWAYGGNAVYKIDTKTDKVVSTLTVALQPNSLVVDKHGKLWVLSDGGYVGSPNGHDYSYLTKINLDTFTVEDRFKFDDILVSPSELTIDAEGSTLYFINGGWGSPGVGNGLIKMSVDAISLPEKAFIEEGSSLFYAVAVDPYNGDIYLSDAIDYAQKGSVTRYCKEGVQRDKFKTDISSGAFAFFTL